MKTKVSITPCSFNSSHRVTGKADAKIEQKTHPQTYLSSVDTIFLSPSKNKG
ncbi:hypothetical protein VCR4J5_1500030 [Vibrio crassostreae]|uniref:Uncharacterized protein n=1 Tax=Vibrio crassostreae TaxID=246167 RepID=A0A822MVG9_9VIBR|nr:hypothetical protein VCRA2119O48_270064 [Vibrio crassostreae]CAK3867151.1 hypothetical protein VCRA212O16_270002 [Vibrio crassostreae]CDT02006.1 hypothetical protein VCR5J5_1370054 [Vibrio crassostreae]CDT02144.1 hypothetical protein VCR19J5_1210224 [Vibrio crassostreae]CDT08947.1 hypothetical protein VCR4J5_1500030 [Vibrio crassostreae]